MIAFTFAVAALCGIFIAFYLKFRLSGPHLNYLSFYSCLVFNGVFVVPYIDIIQSGCFLFFGCRPDIISHYPFIGWAALVCVFIHLFALPVKKTTRRYFF